MSCNGEFNDAAAVAALIQENHDLRQQTLHYCEQMNEALRALEAIQRDIVADIETALEAKRHA